MSVDITIHLSDELEEKLDVIARATGQSRSEVLHKAIRSYIESESRFVAAVMRGRTEIAAGRYIEWEDFERELDVLVGGDGVE
ncbi:MAG: hypothetical protein GFH27_549283n308 [Chloroflexi bacterium AL-W]|nr:hypothetical protein [Chloroflexi bacterium AL-N1]NOK64570.1 hypothetical protein [Chloroflexi bacterium AL-N10]NOK75812.1 hypothetical protein [Chloroflexi bacterium AL-N5]NOK80429.1 hypothetical protein [Chloroflexi bacterium AL-W]NOK86943.1 hypothetical protein [Chloroflexi bacterium AL-N15]